MGTPGPWKVYEGADAESLLASGWVLVVHHTDAGNVVANVFAGRSPGEVRNRPGEANARLIAAAPDILSSLKECVMELRQLHAHHYPKCEGGCPAEVYLQKAQRVIAEAERK